jgi:hypothetical protein
MSRTQCQAEEMVQDTSDKAYKYSLALALVGGGAAVAGAIPASLVLEASALILGGVSYEANKQARAYEQGCKLEIQQAAQNPNHNSGTAGAGEVPSSTPSREVGLVCGPAYVPGQGPAGRAPMAKLSSPAAIGFKSADRSSSISTATA